MNQQHVTPIRDKWQVIGDNYVKATRLFDSQEEAVEFGKIVAKDQKAELLIHGRDGTIREKISYGNDPFPPRG